MGTPPFPEIRAEQVHDEFVRAMQLASPIAAVEPLAKAYGHLSFKLTAEDGAAWLVKIAREPAEVSRLARTRDAVAAAQAHGVPVAPILRVAVSEHFGGRPYAIQAFLPGNDAEDAWPALDGAQRSQFLEAFGEATGRLHTVGAPVFTEGAVGEEAAASWKAHVAVRLAHLKKLNARWGAISEAELARAVMAAGALATAVEKTVAPVLVHRDLFLRNALMDQGRFRAILDFEHARYSDPVMEFVKLQTLLFDVHPGAEARFMAGYRRVHPLAYPMWEERLRLCWGMELLGTLPFLARNGMAAELVKTQARFREWLAAAEQPVEVAILGFHQDEEAHWVADLSCGHTQHMRHDPPWQVRPWVVTDGGRARYLGARLHCAKCIP